MCCMLVPTSGAEYLLGRMETSVCDIVARAPPLCAHAPLLPLGRHAPLPLGRRPAVAGLC